MRRRPLALLASAALALSSVLAFSAPAQALSPSVSFAANDLPTWQTNGIAWTLAQSSGVVFAGGTFTQIRPPGTAAGDPASRSASNFAAFDAATGNPTSCALNFTGTGSTVRALSVTPDGRRLYVGGSFGAVNGAYTTRIVAISLPTCTLDTTFRPVAVSATVRTIKATNSAVYFGGDFQSVGSETRNRFAAMSSTGALLPWNPAADAPGRAIDVPAGRNVVILGGDFATMNGSDSKAIAVVDATTGINVKTYPNNFIPRTSVTKAIVDDGTSFYIGNEGTGGGVFDGRARISLDTYEQVWRDTCLGATQTVDVYRGVLYAGHHQHDCGSMNEHADGVRQHLTAQSVDDPAPQLGWSPDTNDGLGEKLGPRTMVHTTGGTNDMLWVGGEFTTTNGHAQQGLTRFGPGPGAAAPSIPTNVSSVSLVAGQNQVRWRASVDDDDSELTYSVYRNGSSTPLGSVRASSLWWSQGQVSFTDTTATPGTPYSYRIRATDDTNTGGYSASTAVTTARTTASYPAAVRGDGASTYWRLDDPAGGTVGADASAGNNLALSYGGPGFSGDTGAIVGDTSRSATFNGSQAQVYGQNRGYGPAVYSAEIWFKTNTQNGGKIFGYGNGQPNRHGTNPGLSGQYDRNLYMTNAGTLVYGVYVGGFRTVTTPLAYNDNAWHHVVATQGSDGIKLYVDGAQVGSLNETGAENYWGSWKIGGDQLNSWPQRPSSAYFAGSLDEFAVYPTVLSADRVTNHYRIGSGVGQPAPDTQAPATVQGVSAITHSNDVTVAWSGTTDNVGVTAYQVHRSATSGFTPTEATRVQTTGADARSWTDTGRSAGTWYYRLVATDEAQNTSDPSAQATATVAPAPVTVTVNPTADTYVNAGAPSTVSGTAQSMATRGTAAYLSYLRFNAASQVPAGYHLSAARLRFTTTADSFAGSTDTQSVVQPVGAWSEATTAYNNRPTIGSTVLGTGTAPAVSTAYTIDLDASALAGQLTSDINVALTSNGSDNLWLSSREAAAAKRPALVLTFAPNA